MTESQNYPQPPMPSYPAQHPAAAIAQRPRPLRWALGLALGNAAWATLVTATALSFVDIAALRQQPDFQAQQLTDYQIQQVIELVTTGMIAFLLVACAVWGFFTAFMYKGRNWSRIVLTVLAGLWFLATVLSIAMPVYGGAVVKALLAGQLVLLVALLCLMYQSDSSDYFARR